MSDFKRRYVLVLDVELEPKDFDFKEYDGDGDGYSPAEERKDAIEDAWQQIEDGIVSADVERGFQSTLSEWYGAAARSVSMGGGTELGERERLVIIPNRRLARNRNKRPVVVARGI